MTQDKLLTYATKLLGGPPGDVSDWQVVARELFQEHMDHQPRAVRHLEAALEHIELRFADVLEVADRIPDSAEEELSQDVANRVFGLFRDLKGVREHLVSALIGGDEPAEAIVVLPQRVIHDAIKEADEALNGDSNDAEHDALYSLYEQLSGWLNPTGGGE